MSKINLFILIPVQHQEYSLDIKTDDIIFSIEQIQIFIHQLKLYKEAIHIENYTGYYDITNFLYLVNSIDILEECYPKPTKRLLSSLLKDYHNWRENIAQSKNNKYTVYNQVIENHTLCEIAQRMHDHDNEKFILLNHMAIKSKECLDVKINTTENKNIKVLNTKNELTDWFSTNRIPKRNFHVTKKHNIPCQKIIKNKLISPFKGTAKNAEIILQKAIGQDINELYGYDQSENMIIVFKFENSNPQNLYHGYHVPIDSIEIPQEIRTKLLR